MAQVLCDFKEIIIIGIEDMLPIDYSGLSRICVFNKKKKKFILVKPSDIAKSDEKISKWIGSRIIN